MFREQGSGENFSLSEMLKEHFEVQEKDYLERLIKNPERVIEEKIQEAADEESPESLYSLKDKDLIVSLAREELDRRMQSTQ